MEQAETILVVILAAFLAIFLLLGIVLLVKCIQIANRVKRLTERAEHLADKAESVGSFFKAASGNFAAGRVLSGLVHAVMHRDEAKSKERSR